MVTRATSHSAGLLAVVTGGLLGASVMLFDRGPSAPYPGPVRDWFVDQAATVRISAILGFAAMVTLVAFAVAFREATWALVADHTWTSVLALQGMALFGLLAVGSAAIVWSLADQAEAGILEPATAATLWSLARVLFRFATWGLILPLVATTLALSRYSRMGRTMALMGLFIGVLLFAPSWAGLYAFAIWMLVIGAMLALPVRRRVAAQVPVTP